jgi:hypothetical protein
MRMKKRGGLREGVKKRESERDFFYFIKILYLVATELPNTYRITSYPRRTCIFRASAVEVIL